MITRKALTVVGIAIVLIASGSNHTAMAGINGGGKTGSSKGKINRFGSIYVNGVRYTTDNALFLVDGKIGLESDLDVDQVVTVLGSINADGSSGTAHLVIYEDAVEGPVAAIDGNQFEVLGQTVIVDGNTSVALNGDRNSLGQLHAGEIVEVSGHSGTDGAIIATHIRSSRGQDEYDLTGIVAGIETHALRLTIGRLNVDFSAANLYGFDNGTPSVGDRVEVVGSAVNEHGELVATRIQSKPLTISTQAGEAAQIEGLVTRYVSPWDFDVDGVRVAITWNTQFDGGWLFHIQSDARVEVAGEFDGNGHLVANRIEFERTASAAITGFVTAVDNDAVSVDGTWIRIDNDTSFEDHSDADERRFDTNDLRTGDLVRVRFHTYSGDARATRLERLEGGYEIDRFDDDKEMY